MLNFELMTGQLFHVPELKQIGTFNMIFLSLVYNKQLMSRFP